MRKYVRSIFLIITMVLLAVLMSNSIVSTSYTECIADETLYQKVLVGRQENEALLLELCFDEQELFYEENTKTFYYSLVEGNSDAYEPEVDWRSESKKVSVRFLGQITKEGIKKNQTIPIVVYSEDYYYIYNLKCTTLPLMNINVKAEITKTEIPMELTLFDNRKGAAKRVTNSNGTIKVRGASSSRLLKTSYRVSLTTDSLGENTRANHVSLLGMRQDEDWILYAPFNDQEKVRNVFNTNLWTETCGANNEEGIQTGIEYKYFELFVNGDYMGLYALGYPIDEKLMGIDEADGEILYKKVGWGSESVFAIDRNATYGEFIKGFEVKTLKEDDTNDIYRKWARLLEFYQQYDENKDDNEQLMQMIDISNAIDTYLFISLIQGYDNIRNAEVRNMYFYMCDNEGDLKILYAPWDMDITWGNYFTEDWYANYVLPYNRTPQDKLVMTAGPLNQLLLNGAEEIWEQILVRYRELRENGWSDEHVSKLLKAYEQDIYDSGAYRREAERWPEGSAMNPEEGLRIFKEYVLERFAVMDAYYEKAEYPNRESRTLGEKYTFSVNSEGCTDLKLYLTMLSFWDQEAVIEIHNKRIWQDAFCVELFENMGVQMECITESTGYLLIKPSEKFVEYYEEYQMPKTENDSDVRIILRDKEDGIIVEDANLFL